MNKADVCNNGEQKEGEESPIGDAETPGSVVSGDFVVVGGMGGVDRPDIAGWGAEGSVKQDPSFSSDGKAAVSSAPNTAATSLGGLWRAAFKDMGRSLLGMAGKRNASSGEDRKDDDDDDHVLHPIPLLSLEEVVENARKGSLPQLVMLPDCLFPEGVFEVLSLVFGGRLSIVCIDPKTRASRERIEKTLRIHEGRSCPSVPDTVVTLNRCGEVLSVPYRGNETFEALALFAAVHTFTGGPAASYLDSDNCVMQVSTSNASSFLGRGGAGEAPKVLLFTHRTEVPGWYLSISRIFFGVYHFGMVRDATLLETFKVKPSSLDPNSISNPSKLSFVLQILRPTDGGDEDRREYRGAEHIPSICVFLALACPTREQSVVTASKTGGAWVSLPVKHQAAELRSRIKDLMSAPKRAWENQRRIKAELQRIDAAAVMVDALPKWPERRCDASLRGLLRQCGLPPRVRGQIWAYEIGNKAKVRAEQLRVYVGEGAGHENWTHGLVEGHEGQGEEGRRGQSLRQIHLDLERTFPDLCFFNADGPYHYLLRDVLWGYTCHRSVVGYVQGMSHVAAMLLLNMGVEEAFVCMVNLLDRWHFRDFFMVDMPRVDRYAHAINTLLARSLTALYSHLRVLRVDSRIYIIEWWMTAFASVLPLDAASRVWDSLILDGLPGLIKATLALLKVLSKRLLSMDFDKVLYLLTHIDEAEVDGDELMTTASQMSVDEDEFMAIVEANHAGRDAGEGGAPVVWGGGAVPYVGMRVEMCEGVQGRGLGIITRVNGDQSVTVTWDSGQILNCKSGRDGATELQCCLGPLVT